MSGWTPPSATWRRSRTQQQARRHRLRQLLESGLRRRASYHFIGKDIAYFHCLFWPAMLEGANFPQADQGQRARLCDRQRRHKMSKSKGTFIKASTYLKHLDPECLRYYYAAKLNSRIDDLDLNLEDFVSRVNADVVNKLVNLASRNAGFIAKSVLTASWPPPAPSPHSTPSLPAPAPASPKPGEARANSAAPSARSWPGRQGQPLCGRQGSPGHRQAGRGGCRAAKPSAPSASTCSAC